MRFINPTGMGIRNDSKGLGHHGAPRGYRKHNGVDFECKDGQDILMPVDGLIARISLPYKDDLKWKGVEIINPRVEIKMWYFVPDFDLIGKELKAGEVIGMAQNIGKKYPGVTSHIHVRITKVDPMLLFSETDEEIYKDVLRGI
ncbi:MAG: hypothetical protein U9Q18_01530 [Caldisericota bacterium]|nr:hypothetical protein [Caldisericota bacterium]